MEMSVISNDTMSITCTEEKDIGADIEELKQELYQTKRQLEQSERLRNEIEQENSKLEEQIKILQCSFEVEKGEFIKNMKNLRANHDEEREQCNTEYNELLRKLEELQTHEAPKVEVRTDYSALEEVVSLSKIEIAQLKHELFEKKEAVCELECTTIQLTDRIKELENELGDMRESIKCKSESLQDTLKALEELKEEKALLSTELAELKQGPIKDPGRGNSLFSEIEDKRAILERKLANIHKKYVELKKVLVMKSSELEKYKIENIRFQAQFEEDSNNLKIRDSKVIECYKQRIAELTHRVSELELRPENPTIVTVSDKNLSNMQWIHTIVDEARAEVRDLKRALGEKSMEKILTAEKIADLTAEVINLKRQSVVDKAMIDNLERKLSSYENDTIRETFPEKQELEKKEPVKAIRFADDVKENDGVALKRAIKKSES